jgi:putative ABC transport system permease protein
MRLALRHLRTSPGYTAAAVTTLALAIGASTAIFSAVYAVLLKPMPLRDPGRLVVAWGTSPSANMRVLELSYLDVQDIGAAAPATGVVASHSSSTWTAVLDGVSEPLKVPTTGVSGNFFEVLGAVPLLGRVIRPDEDRTKSAPVVVLSHALWVRQFGSDRNIVGKRIRLDERLHEVIGVMPEGFNYPQGTDAWRAAAPIIGDPVPGGNPNPLRNFGLMFLIGRLNPGITPEQAASNWTRVHAEIMAATMPAGIPPRQQQVAVLPFLDHQIGPARQAMWVLFAAVGVLLLIACANVSGLMLTRVALRSHEDAIRVAVGGTRWAVARLWLAETVWLTAIGGALGLLTCQWLIDMIVALAPEGIPRLDEVAIDRVVAAFSIGVMGIATLLCAAAPIRHAGSVSLVDSLNDGSRSVAGGRSYRTRSSLLVVQIGLAVVLLVAAGLVVRSFDALQKLDVGFARDGVLRMKVEPRIEDARVNQWVADLLPAIAALPEVDAAGAVYLTPMEFGSIGHGTWAIAEGQPESPETAQRNPVVNYLSATPEYFRAMGIPLLRGRMFNDDDRATAPRVTLISESTAAAFFPGQDPIGKRLQAASFTGTQGGAWRTIIGVVGNVRYRGLHEVPLDMYDPPSQQSRAATTSLAVRLKDGQQYRALAVAAAVSTQARNRDPRVLISGISMLDAVIGKAVAPWRFSAWVFALFAALAFALAMVGLFSLVSLDVANRRREFAIRMAVGATSDHIVSGVFRSAGRRAALGIIAGVAVAAIATRSLQDLLFGIALLDVTTYTMVIVVVVGVVASAAYLPARRAAATSPLALLRRD